MTPIGEVREKSAAVPALPAGTRFRRDRWASPTGALVVLLVLLTLPFWLTDPALRSLSVTACITAIAVYGLELLYAQVGSMSVAHAALQGAGAYAAAILLRDFGVNFWFALPCGAVAGAVLACLLGLATARVSGHYFVILTFAFGGFLVIALTNGGSVSGGADGILLLEPIPEVFGWAPRINDVRGWYYFALAFLVLSILVSWLVTRTRFAASCRAVRENEQLARAVGVNVAAYRVAMFAVSGAFAGLSGVLYFNFVNQITPNEFGISPSVQLVLMMMIGGTGALLGPLAGAALVVFLPAVINLDPVVGQIAYGVILVLVILVLPQGIIPALGDLVRRLRSLVRPRTATVSGEG